MLIRADIVPRATSLKPFCSPDHPTPHRPVLFHSVALRPRGDLPNLPPHYSNNPPPLPGCAPCLPRTVRPYDGAMECPILHPSLCPRRSLLVPRHRRLDPHPYKRRLCPRRPPSRLAPHSTRRQFLALLRRRLCPLPIHPPTTRVLIHPRNTSSALSPSNASKRTYHRRGAQLHSSASLASNCALDAFHRHVPPRYLSWLCG